MRHHWFAVGVFLGGLFGGLLFAGGAHAAFPRIAAGQVHIVALKSNGTVWAWGGNSNGQASAGPAVVTAPQQVPGLSSIVSIGAGFSHSLAVTADGAVFAWGSNFSGELGDGTTIGPRHSPVQVPALSGVAAIAGGVSHTVALKADGTVWSWGGNASGQLGDGTNAQRLAPVQVIGLAGVVAIAVGDLHNLALKSDGTVWAWGRGGFGELGDGGGVNRNSPVQVSTLEDVVKIAAGGGAFAFGRGRSMALKADGTVWAWGSELGTQTSRLTPVQVPGPGGSGFLSDVANIALGWNHAFAVKTDGTVFGWGGNQQGELGIGNFVGPVTHPAQLATFSAPTQIAAGFMISAALKNGAVWAWGDNISGGLGTGGPSNENVPARVLGANGSAFALRRDARDFGGDGRSDVLWRNGATGENYLYPMNGTTILAAEGHLRTVSDLDWGIAGTGDFDGDGAADILWRHGSSGENYIYFMSGISIVNEGYLRTVADPQWRIAGVGDFDGDGRADILWRHATSGENYVYLMNGLSIANEGYLRTVAALAWEIKGVGDFDGDERADILWRNSITGENYLYPMDGTTIKDTEGFIRTVADPQWQIKALADFDGDGRTDIAWRHASSGENYLYLMQGTTIAAEGYLRTVADLAWRIVGSGDYDGDGRSDLLWRNAATGENYMYFMNATSIVNEGYLRTVPVGSWAVAGP